MQTKIARQYLDELARFFPHALSTLKRLAQLQGTVIVIQMTALAILLAGTIEGKLEMQHQLLLVAVLFATLVLRHWLFGRFEQHASQLQFELEQKARSLLLQRWRMQAKREGVLAEDADLFLTPIQQLGPYFVRFLPSIANAKWQPLLILGIVLYFDWIAATFLLLSAPLIPIFMAIVGMGAEQISQRHLESVKRLSGLFLDHVRHLTTLQIFAQTERAEARVEAGSERYRKLNMATLKVAFLSSAVLEFFASIAIAAVAIYVGFALLGFFSWGPATELTLMSGLTILLLAPEFFQPLRTLAQHYHDRAGALAAAELLRSKENEGKAALSIDAEHSRAKVEPQFQFKLSELGLKVASYTHQYQDGTMVEWPSFSAQAGQIVCLKGPSGSGKSTLLQALAGNLSMANEPQPFTFEPSQYQQAPIAFLQQRPFLIHGSVADNLRLIAPDASDESLQHALRQVGLWSLVEQFPNDLEQAVGEQAKLLSGGEAQRLALARVVLAPTPMVLLDEPSAAVDPDSAQIIIEGLVTLAERGCLIILASHNPQLEEIADVVVTLSSRS